MTIIQLDNINKWYDESKHVLKSINLQVHKGEFIAICGKSGQGKSTLLNIIGLLDIPDSGDYYLNGTKIDYKDPKNLSKIRNEYLGFIFQSYYLIPNLTVYENVMLPHVYSPEGFSHTSQTRATQLMLELGIDGYRNKKIENLSGGEKQRVAIARALVNDPQIIIADEPTGNLDSENMINVVTRLKKENAEGKTIIVVTHDMKVADYADKVYFINNGELYLNAQ